MSCPSAPYTEGFLTEILPDSVRSARAVLPLVFDLVKPESLVDVGSGLGAWAAVAIELGVLDVVAIDGDYVPRGKLLIPASRFLARNLEQPFTLDRTFDLALCMEVAEHLPASSASVLIHSITQLAPTVLFSAAVPGQGGNHHLNEQWPQYWARTFQERGFVALDCIRPRIWHNKEVGWCYSQNSFLYVRLDWLRLHPVLECWAESCPRSLIHPVLYQNKCDAIQRPSGRPLLAALPGALARSLRHRAKRLTSWRKPAEQR